MKIQVVSDLHLSKRNYRYDGLSIFQQLDPLTNDIDVLVLAGDVIPIEYLMENLDNPLAQELREYLCIYDHVIWVAGNHEYYSGRSRFSSVPATFEKHFRDWLPNNVHYVGWEPRMVVINDVNFYCSMLWAEGSSNPIDEIEIRRAINDFNLIPGFQYPDMVQEFYKNRQWLRKFLELYGNDNRKNVVVTHHGCHPNSTHERFKNSAINGAFVSDLSDIISSHEIELWIHGHTHNFFDYTVDGTRVLVNPRGYVSGPHKEHDSFRPNLTVEV